MPDDKGTRLIVVDAGRSRGLANREPPACRVHKAAALEAERLAELDASDTEESNPEI
jgi:hypothetical protein